MDDQVRFLHPIYDAVNIGARSRAITIPQHDGATIDAAGAKAAHRYLRRKKLALHLELGFR